MRSLTQRQLSIIESPLPAKTFLEGPAGTGKTTVGVERLIHMLEHGVPGDSILAVVPQRTIAVPYYPALREPGLVPGGLVKVTTIGGLAGEMVDLFWPLIGEEAGFANPEQLPTFLNLETAQYHMGQIVQPLLETGYFDGLTIDRKRLYGQILDNLNKAAFVGFPLRETLCTHIKKHGRKLTLGPQAEHETIHTRRQYQHTEAFKKDYARRAGVEGAISQTTHALEMRRTRYRGLTKTHLQHLAAATAVNLKRAIAWFLGVPSSSTQISAFAALVPS